MAPENNNSGSKKEEGKPKEQDLRPVIKPEYLKEQKKEKADKNKRLNEG